PPRPRRHHAPAPVPARAVWPAAPAHNRRPPGRRPRCSAWVDDTRSLAGLTFLDTRLRGRGYWAMNSLSAKRASLSTQRWLRRKPIRDAKASIWSAAYLYELSVQIVSLAANENVA